MAPNSISFTGSSDEHIITADENKEFKLICKVDIGYPPPNLHLFWNDTLVQISESRTIIYEINLTRADDFSNVTCIANHSEVYNPLEIQAVIHLNCKRKIISFNLATYFDSISNLVIKCITLNPRTKNRYRIYIYLKN